VRTVQEFFDKLPATRDALLQYLRDEGVKGNKFSCPLIVLSEPWLDEGYRLAVGNGRTYVYYGADAVDQAPNPPHVREFVFMVDTGHEAARDVAGDWFEHEDIQ